MPNHILIEDMLNDMIEKIDYIKVKSYLKLKQ